MKITRSPWIHQLDAERPINTLEHDLETDVVIVGAGIAGISTAFFVLRHTDKKVTIIEKYKLAHGATGHNAGQVVTYFERAFSDLVQEFGLELATKGQQSIDLAWNLLHDMYKEAGMTIPFSRFPGHAGFSTFDELLHELEDLYWKKTGGMTVEPVYIADHSDWMERVPIKYKGLYRPEKHEVILNRLETQNTSYLAVHTAEKGCINSALFCQELLRHITQKYPDRFTLYEKTNVEKVVLHKDVAILDTVTHTVTAQRVVLCTNGFENFSIYNESGLDIDTAFHHKVEGKVGYMSGYLETQNKPPAAISYYTNMSSTIKDPYFYLTRRDHEFEGKKDYNLICVGGPDISLEDRTEYIYDYDFPEEAQKQIDEFVKNTYDPDPNKKITYNFTWHGLMGYTTNGVRLIGCEPKNPVLLYNLGCNGVGILPSIHGGDRISRIIAGEKLQPSMFDPR